MENRYSSTRDGNVCPICGEGVVSDRIELLEIPVKNVVKTVHLRYKECNYCCSEFTDLADSKINKLNYMNVFGSID